MDILIFLKKFVKYLRNLSDFQEICQFFFGIKEKFIYFQKHFKIFSKIYDILKFLKKLSNFEEKFLNFKQSFRTSNKLQIKKKIKKNFDILFNKILKSF